MIADNSFSDSFVLNFLEKMEKLVALWGVSSSELSFLHNDMIL